jgi:hypothetical protein
MNLDNAIQVIRQRWPAARSSAPDEPIFVLAAGWRSGSTLLQRMLLKRCLVWGEPYGSSGLIERLAQPLQRFASNWPQDNFLVTSPHWGERLGDQWTANLYPSVRQFLAAHVAFFQTLFAQPAQERGFARWGLKEVRYAIEHTVYLRWLFPRARFVFLVRDPFACWASYRRAQSRVLRFWPEELITTPEQFGNHWRNLADGFCNRYQEVDGFLLRYESLNSSGFDAKPLETYLGVELDLQARLVVVGASPAGALADDEVHRLQQTVDPVAGRLGYVKTLTPPR